MGFFVVPFAIIALLLTPFGLDAWAWRAAAWWMERILDIASGVSGLEGAVSTTPQWPLSAMLALTLGGLWLCLSRAPWRLAGLAAIPVAALFVTAARPPALFVSPTGKNAGFIAASHDGAATLYVQSTKRERFAASLWEEAAGLDPETVRPQPFRDILVCDETGCQGGVTDLGAVTVAFTEQRAELAEDCARADLVIAFFPVSADHWRACNAYLIDRRSVWKRGAHAVWIERDGGLKVKTANDIRGDRPWTSGG